MSPSPANTSTAAAAITAAAAGKTILIRVPLDEELFDALEFQALTTSTDLETLIAARLAATLDYSAANPIYLDDDQVLKLRGLLGNGVTSPATLIAKIKMLMTARIISSVKNATPLPPIRIRTSQIEQIGSYARTMGISFDEAFVVVVEEAIAARLQA